MSDFAKQQLVKYGWTEGKGLGKNETGVKEALKVKPKVNNEGLGYNSLSNTEWWRTSFDNASKNIVVNKQKDKISFSVNKNSTADKVAEATLKYKDSRQKMYNDVRKIQMTDFIKETTGKEIENVENEKKEASRVSPILIDYELFKACGGRTGHKGARHGVTMSGKLERVRKQEKRLLHLMKRLSLKNANKAVTEVDGNVAKLNSNNNNNTNVAVINMDESSSKENDFQVFKSKATIKKEKKKMRNLTRLLNVQCNISDGTFISNIKEIKKSSKHRNKKSKGKKSKTSLSSSSSEIFIPSKGKHDLADSNPCIVRNIVRKRRKKRRAVVNQNNTLVENIYKDLVDRSLDNELKQEEVFKSQGDSNINPKSTGFSPAQSNYCKKTSLRRVMIHHFLNSIESHQLLNTIS